MSKKSTIKKCSVPDLLRMEGIMVKGYGCVAKFAMQDSALDLTAKGLYAYLCSLTGGGTTTWPLRENMLRILKIGKTAYYSALKQLTDSGYITISKKRISGQWDRNIYTIVSNPKRFTATLPTEGESQLLFSSMRSAGFGIVPRLPMQDGRMTIREKALYAYMLCYAVAGSTAFPRFSVVKEHLQISPSSFQKYMKTLERLGYIKAQQRRVESGQFGVVDYYISEQPVEVTPDIGTWEQKCDAPNTEKPDTVNQDMVSLVSPDVKNPDTVNQDMVNPVFSPDTKNPDTVEPDMPHPDTVNPDIITNTSSIYYHSQSITTEEDLPHPERKADQDSDWTETLRRDMVREGGISKSLIGDSRKMEAALRIACGFHKGEPWYDDASEQEQCEIVFDALRLMCCRPRSKVKGKMVEAWQVIDMLNSKCIERFPYQLDMMDAFEYLVEAYFCAVRDRVENHQEPLKHPVAYAKFVIWDALERYEKPTESLW